MTLQALRDSLPSMMSDKRLSHTLGVEKEVRSLAKIFALSERQTTELQIAALLHDITKEKSLQEQLALCRQFGIAYTDADCAAPKTFHAKTGAAWAKQSYPALVTDRIAQAIWHHTVGAADLSLFDALLYLADYIEPTRTFEDCVKLRQFFYDGIHNEANPTEHLQRTLLLSVQMTIRDLLSSNAVIAPDTLAMYNALVTQSLSPFPKKTESQKGRLL